MRNIHQPQPATMLYVFDRGWRVIRYALELLRERMIEVGEWWVEKVGEVRQLAGGRHWFIRYWVYFGAGSVALAGIIQCLGMVVVAAVLLGMYALFLAIWAGICLSLIGILATFTSLNAKRKAIFFCCPNCHKNMPIPVFLCPICGAGHTRLQPSRYGIFWHRCNRDGNGCDTKIPTLDGLGRSKLKRKCPYPRCGRPLNKGIGKGSNIHIPIVGGTSVGKTNYMVMALDAFIRTFETEHGYIFSFPDPLHQNVFERNVQRLAAGRELPITTDLIPQAYNLIFKAPMSFIPPRGFVPKLLYIYDAAGEIFKTNEQMDLQDYYDYTKGIIFVIDPFAIQAYCLEHQEDIERILSSLRPSRTGVMETYERLKEKIEKVSGLGKKSRYSMPIAIVVSKVDALNLEDEIGLPAAKALMAQDPSISTEEDAISDLVRKFLCKYGLNNFVHDLELYFSKVKYFSCSALGRLPAQANTSSFTPVRVLDPLVWLLAHA